MYQLGYIYIYIYIYIQFNAKNVLVSKIECKMHKNADQ